jgi:capsid protein
LSVQPGLDPKTVDFLNQLEAAGTQPSLASQNSVRPSYWSGGQAKTTKQWQPELRSADSALQENWMLSLARFRDAARNQGVLKKAGRQFSRLVIARGIATFADVVVGKQFGEWDDDFNDESDLWFERWAEEQADASGNYHLHEMQRLSFDELPFTGNSYWIEIQKRGRDRIVPLTIGSPDVGKYEHQSKRATRNVTVPSDSVHQPLWLERKSDG